MAEQHRIRLKQTTSTILAAAAIVLAGLALYSGAWFADDALRLWRISLNWIHLGTPAFNPGHRTLGFEQPLWLMVLTAGFALGGRLAATAVALQFLLFCAGALLLWECHRLTLPPGRSRAAMLQGAAKVAFVAALLAMSNSFREYMVAGLENALLFFLVSLLAFLMVRLRAGLGADETRMATASVLAASLILTTRPDFIWALSPAAAFVGWRFGPALLRYWRSFVLGCIPVALWLVYSAVHFGRVFPLQPESGLLRREILTHGELYLLGGAIQEPLTFLLLSLALIAGTHGWLRPRKNPIPMLLGAGGLAYLLSAAWHGGTTAGGRMLCPVAIMSAAALACAPAFQIRAYCFAACYIAIFFDLGKVSLLTGGRSRVPRTAELFRDWGIIDEYANWRAIRPEARSALERLRSREWRARSEPGPTPTTPLFSLRPGRDGIAAGPARTVEDIRTFGLPRPELDGTAALMIRFRKAERGVTEPILALGDPANGTLVMAEHLPRDALRFQIWKPGSVPIFSRAVPSLDYGAAHRLVISYGSKAAGREDTVRFVVMLDGVLLKDFQREARRYNFDEVVAGFNVQANPDCAPRFLGQIDSVGPSRAGEIDQGSWPMTIAKRNLIELDVRFSKVTNSAEPLVVTGSEAMGDIVFVRRVSPGRVVFGQEHWGQAPELGPVTEIDDDREHRLQIALGPLFTLSDAIVRPDCVRVTMDGGTVLASRQALYPFKPTEVCVLDNPLAGSFSGRDFLGTVERAETVTLEPLFNSVSKVLKENTGPISMTLLFDGSIVGRALGLLEVGIPGAGDIVYVIVQDRTHVRFYYDHWGYGGISGSVVEIDPAKPHVLTIAMGSLDSAGDPRSDLATMDRATLDGRVVLEGRSPSASAKNGPIHLLQNALVSSNVSAPFDGTCLGIARGGASVNLSY